jgi:hypothetical protein
MVEFRSPGVESPSSEVDLEKAFFDLAPGPSAQDADPARQAVDRLGERPRRS